MEMAENTFELVDSSSHQDYAFAHWSSLKVEDCLDRVSVAWIRAQPPNALCGIGHHPARRYVAGGVMDQWMKLIVQEST
jgi:hypothetical protein